MIKIHPHNKTKSHNFINKRNPKQNKTNPKLNPHLLQNPFNPSILLHPLSILKTKIHNPLNIPISSKITFLQTKTKNKFETNLSKK